MFDIIAELLLVWVMGCAMLIAAFIVGDVSGDWMARVIRNLRERYYKAKTRVGWEEVAARHRRKVNV